MTAPAKVFAATMAALASAAAAAMAASGCGEADIVAPEPLTVVDTSPGSGALVPAGALPIVVLFSLDVDAATLEGAIGLEETTSAGAPIASIPTPFDGYDAGSFAARYSAGELAEGSYFRLTVERDAVRATSGTTLRRDFVRAFRTLED